MQLGKSSKKTELFEQIRGELPPEAEVSAPLISNKPAAAAISALVPAPRTSASTERQSVHITVAEAISAKLSREGSLESFEVKGDLQLRISDASLTQIKLKLDVDESRGAQYSVHPKVDKGLFSSSRVVQLKDTSRGFPANNPIGVMRWRLLGKAGEAEDLPITFTVWVNDGSDGVYNITVEYELTGNDSLRDVAVTIPYLTTEPAVSSFDAVYEVAGDSIEWNIGAIDKDTPTGSFEFEGQASTDAEFFPMSVRFSKNQPFVDVDVGFVAHPRPQKVVTDIKQVSSITLLNIDQEISFSKDVKSVADKYLIG